MDNQEFSKLAKQVSRIAKAKAKKGVIKKINDADFHVEIKNDKFGQRMQMWFFSKDGSKILFDCEYDLKTHKFKD